MCFILFDVFKHLLLRKTDVLTICRKNKFLGKKIWRNALVLKSKKIQDIFGKRTKLYNILDVTIKRISTEIVNSEKTKTNWNLD